MSASRGYRTPWRLGGAAGLAAAVLLAVGPAGPGRPPTPPPPPGAPDATVTVVGSGSGLGPLGERLPSGQAVAYRAVPEWAFPAGTQAGAATVAAGGGVLVAGRDHHGGNGPPTATELMIGSYQPGTGSYTPIQVPATGGAAPVDGSPDAPSIAGLAPLAGSGAVAFTVGPGPGAGRTWPVLGVLTMVDGAWRVASRWTADQLRSVGLPWNAQDCPADRDGDCRGLGELVALPHSGDLLVTQAAVPGARNGALLAVRLAGPGSDGEFTVTVTGHYPYPEVRDPQTGADLNLALRSLRADPTGAPGRERFVVGLQDLADTDRSPMVVQEFSYDAATGAITPVSAPTLPGDRPHEDAAPYGYSAALYDHDGNLWVARHNWLAGGRLAVYTGSGDGGGVLDRPDCPYRPDLPPADHRTGAEWGQACRPDYDLLQAQALPAVTGLVQNPQGEEIVALTLGGALLAIRPEGRGDSMTFQIGNLVETGLRLLPAAREGVREHWLGGFDAAGRLWLAGANAEPERPGAVTDQWLYGIRVAELFHPEPLPLPEVPGRVATIPAGHTLTTGTEPIGGAWATVDVVSRAYLRGCTENFSRVGCSYDDQPGQGFVLADRTGFGHLRGEVAYRVEVPVAGRYRVGFRVHTFEVITGAAITLSAGGASYTTPIDTDGQWRTVPQEEPIELPAGVHTIRLAPPEGRGGWYLSWFTLQRA